MTQNLLSHRLDPQQMPLVLQYNKRDLPQVLEVEALDRALNTRQRRRDPGGRRAWRGRARDLRHDPGAHGAGPRQALRDPRREGGRAGAAMGRAGARRPVRQDPPRARPVADDPAPLGLAVARERPDAAEPARRRRAAASVAPAATGGHTVVRVAPPPAPEEVPRGDGRRRSRRRARRDLRRGLRPARRRADRAARGARRRAPAPRRRAANHDGGAGAAERPDAREGDRAGAGAHGAHRGCRPRGVLGAAAGAAAARRRALRPLAASRCWRRPRRCGT